LCLNFLNSLISLLSGSDTFRPPLIFSAQVYTPNLRPYSVPATLYRRRGCHKPADRTFTQHTRTNIFPLMFPACLNDPLPLLPRIQCRTYAMQFPAPTQAWRIKPEDIESVTVIVKQDMLRICTEDSRRGNSHTCAVTATRPSAIPGLSRVYTARYRTCPQPRENARPAPHGTAKRRGHRLRRHTQVCKWVDSQLVPRANQTFALTLTLNITQHLYSKSLTLAQILTLTLTLSK